MTKITPERESTRLLDMTGKKGLVVGIANEQNSILM